jgi:hypothetical protein
VSQRRPRRLLLVLFVKTLLLILLLLLLLLLLLTLLLLVRRYRLCNFLETVTQLQKQANRQVLRKGGQRADIEIWHGSAGSNIKRKQRCKQQILQTLGAVTRSPMEHHPYPCLPERPEA